MTERISEIEECEGIFEKHSEDVTPLYSIESWQINELLSLDCQDFYNFADKPSSRLWMIKIQQLN